MYLSAHCSPHQPKGNLMVKTPTKKSDSRATIGFETELWLEAPLWSEHAANERQSRTLATLRDTLLPKLLSGELSVAAVANQ